MSPDVLATFDDLNIPNIDAMHASELLALGETLRALAGYTRHAAHARRIRLECRNPLAHVHEAPCERIYTRLPQSVRW